MVIKVCINLPAKSSSSYSYLPYGRKTGSGILFIPSLRTLRDYKNYIRRKHGFDEKVIADLAKNYFLVLKGM